MAGKRIMQVVYSLGVGGSEMVARDIALGLKGLGWANAVCALERGGALQSELEQAGVQTFVSGRNAGVLGTMFKLFRAIRRFRPDVVHTHHLYELFYAWPGALLCGAGIVHTEHEYFSLENGKARFFIRLLSRLCKRVTAVNRETASYLENLLGWPKDRVATIVNGIDLQAFGEARPDRASLGLAEQDRVIGIVARLEPVKGHDVLFTAFTQVQEKFPDAALLVVGDGSRRQELERMADSLGIAGRVRFLGMRRDVPQLLAAMDVMALSSLEEGLPVSILEAMGAGLPVVASAVGGIPAVVQDLETGMLVPAGDVQALAGALERVLGDAVLARAMGTAGFRLVSGKYGANAMVQSYREIYDAI